MSHNRAVGASCLKETGPLLGHADAVSVARDHEAIRAALGEPMVSFLAISYDSQSDKSGAAIDHALATAYCPQQPGGHERTP